MPRASTSVSKKEEYRRKKKLNRFHERLEDLKKEFEKIDHTEFTKLSLDILELEHFQKLLRRFVKLARKKDELSREGIKIKVKVFKEKLTEESKINESLLNELRGRITPSRNKDKKFRHKYNTKEKFQSAIYTIHSDLILKYVSDPKIIETIDTFRKSINMINFKSTGSRRNASAPSTSGYSDSDTNPDSD
jgi:hypothetical protein